MGTNKSVKPTQELKVAREISEPCLSVSSGLMHLEEILRDKFPEVNEETAAVRSMLQQAWYSCSGRISEAIEIDKIKKSRIFLVSEDIYAKQVPNFVKYLSQFGEPGFGCNVVSRQGFKRVGVFLTKESKQIFIGLFDITSDLKGLKILEYLGYVPTKIRSEKEFHNCYVWHLSDPPRIKGITFRHVKLLAERNKEGQLERVDGYGDRGIEFP